MAAQNLISASISPELKNSIGGHLSGLKTDLGFVIQITPGEKREHLSVGNIMLPFLDKAYAILNSHPEIMPAIFDKEEFIRDYQLTKDLAPIASQLAEMAAAVNNTLHAANSDTFVESLEVYSAAMQNQDKVPGLDVLVAEMKEFFKRTRKKNSASNPAQ